MHQFEGHHFSSPFPPPYFLVEDKHWWGAKSYTPPPTPENALLEVGGRIKLLRRGGGVSIKKKSPPPLPLKKAFWPGGCRISPWNWIHMPTPKGGFPAAEDGRFLFRKRGFSPPQKTGETKLVTSYLHRSGPLLENGLDRPKNRHGRYGFLVFTAFSYLP